MLSIIASMSLFAFIGAASPGPVNIIAVSSSAAFGFKQTVSHVLGASLSYALIVYCVGLGLGEVLLMYPQITQILQYLSAAFLLFIAYKIAFTGAQLDKDDHRQLQRPSLLQGALAQGLNPKAWLVSMSGVSIFVSANNPAELYLLVFTSVSFVICVIGVGIWAIIGQVLSRLLKDVRNLLLFNRVMGALLALSVVSMFL